MLSARDVCGSSAGVVEGSKKNERGDVCGVARREKDRFTVASALRSRYTITGPGIPDACTLERESYTLHAHGQWARVCHESQLPPPCQYIYPQSPRFTRINSQPRLTGLRCGMQTLPKRSTIRSRSVILATYTKALSFACSMSCSHGATSRIEHLVDPNPTSRWTAAHSPIPLSANSTE